MNEKLALLSTRRFGAGLRNSGTPENNSRLVTDVSLRIQGTLKGFGPRVEEWLQGGAIPGFVLDAEAGLFDALYPDTGQKYTRRIFRAFGAETLGAKGAIWIGVEKLQASRVVTLVLHLRPRVF